MYFKIIILLLLSLGMIGCGIPGPSRTCDDVNGTVWHELMLYPNNLTSVQHQIASRFKVPLDQVATTQYKDGGAQLAWSTDQVERTMWLQGSDVFGGTSHFRERPPSADLVTKCLGTPNYYSAEYQREGQEGFRNLLAVDLYFARQGTLASIREYTISSNPPTLSNSTAVNDFLYVPLRSSEETMNQLTYNKSVEKR